jgi:hypothetical protein
LRGEWLDDDAFLTAVFNGMSVTFPAGEKLFIDSVRHFVVSADLLAKGNIVKVNSVFAAPFLKIGEDDYLVNIDGLKQTDVS